MRKNGGGKKMLLGGWKMSWEGVVGWREMLGGEGRCVVLVER